MQSINKQKGVTLLGFLFYGIVFGVLAMITIKAGPVYLNDAGVKRAVEAEAVKLSNVNDVDINMIHDDLKKRWTIDYFEYVEVNDIKLTRDDKGLALSFEYEVKKKLFYNMYLVMEFNHSIPIK